MKLSTAPQKSHPESTSRLPIRDVGRMTFNELDEAFQRGILDAATLIGLQCLDGAAGERIESRLPGYWNSERAASALFTAVTANGGPVSLDALTHPIPKLVSAPQRATRHGGLLVTAIVLVLVFLASAAAALSIATATSS